MLQAEMLGHMLGGSCCPSNHLMCACMHCMAPQVMPSLADQGRRWQCLPGPSNWRLCHAFTTPYRGTVPSTQLIRPILGPRGTTVSGRMCCPLFCPSRPLLSWSSCMRRWSSLRSSRPYNTGYTTAISTCKPGRQALCSLQGSMRADSCTSRQQDTAYKTDSCLCITCAKAPVVQPKEVHGCNDAAALPCLGAHSIVS